MEQGNRDPHSPPQTRQQKHIVQIVPALPPKVDGIGDYALQLARQLLKGSAEGHDVRTTFIAANVVCSSAEVEGFTAMSVQDQTPGALLQVLEDASEQNPHTEVQILVHFSPYGYQLRGCPFWIVEGLERWEKLHPGTVHVAFHELEVHGRPPWSSAFWVPPLQRSLLKRMARLSRFRYTNTELHRGKLEQWGVGRIDIIPNFSTIGEPIQITPSKSRRKDLVIFGRAAQRKWTYQRGAPALEHLCRQLGIERIIDIGEPISGTSPQVPKTPVLRCGRLAVEEVNQWMAASLGSFMYYPVPLLTKSSVHAASASHGCIPFVFDDSAEERSCPTLITGEDFVPISKHAPSLDPSAMDEVAVTVHRNYQARTSACAALRIKAGLRL